MQFFGAYGVGVRPLENRIPLPADALVHDVTCVPVHGVGEMQNTGDAHAVKRCRILQIKL